MLPHAIILVGLPGSGKSTLATKLQSKGWSICSQDAEGGDRLECERIAWEHVSRGDQVIIDRTNLTAEQRALWVSLIGAARQGKEEGPVRIAAVLCDATWEECISRIEARKDHPTLCGTAAQDVVCRCAAELETPSLCEGFSCVLAAGTGASTSAENKVITVAHGASDEAQPFLQHVESALQSGISDGATSSPRYKLEESAANSGCCTSTLGSVAAKMQCVYVTDFRGKASSTGKVDNVATRIVRPEAESMFQSGQFVATVKIHGRCCMWKDGQCFRRLDVNLGPSAQDTGAPKKKIRRCEQALCDAFVDAASRYLGVDLTCCWEAGMARGWSWRDAIVDSWGWVSSVTARGWHPTGAPDRHGHWIGYTPVHHVSASTARVLAVDHDADVRHGFDHKRQVAFCLEWPAVGDGAAAHGRAKLKEVPFHEMSDGSYELIGPNDSHGGPYRRSLPDPTEDAAYCAVKKFPEWTADRNERHYFVRHGAVQWRPKEEGGHPPPSPLDQDALRAWMQGALVEGVVWHGRGAFSGRMFKCHVGHLRIASGRSFAFRRTEHTFIDAAAEASSSVMTSAAVPSPAAGLARFADAADPMQARQTCVRLRIQRIGDRKVTKVVSVRPEMQELLRIAGNKWKKTKVSQVFVEDGAGVKELQQEDVPGLADGTLVLVK